MKNDGKIAGSVERAQREMQELKRVLGESLKACRLEMGITAVDLSIALAVEPDVVRRAEAGDRAISIDILLTSLIGIGLPPADIAWLILASDL